MKKKPLIFRWKPAKVSAAIETPIRIGIKGVQRNREAYGEGIDSDGSSGETKYNRNTVIAEI